MNVVKKHKHFLVLTLITLLLAVIPSLFWARNGFFVGGDDTLLQYMFPEEMIRNFTQNLVINNKFSAPNEYSQQLNTLPLLIVIWGVNSLTGVSNSLYLFLGFILSFGFLATFFLLTQIESIFKQQNHYVEKIIASLIYVLSTYHFMTLLGHKLLAMYIIFVFPISLALFIHSLHKKRLSSIILASIIISIFSVVLMGIPWLAAYIIVSLPLLAYMFKKYPLIFIKHSIVLVLLVILLNVYWIYHFVNAIVTANTSNNLYSQVLTEEYKEDNIETIIGVTGQNNIAHSLLNLFHPDLQKVFKWETYQIYNDWYVSTIYIQFIPLLVIVAACFSYQQAKQKNFIFLLLLFSWLLSLYLFTVKIFESTGTRLFLILNNYVPGFAMFRNNYDKFGSATALLYALTIFISLIQLKKYEKISTKNYNILLVVLSCILLFNSLPIISGVFERRYLYKQPNIQTTITQIDPEFTEFTNELSAYKYEKMAWLPLQTANYLIIPDKNMANHYYVGVSPLVLFSQVHDFTGLLSFHNDDAKVLSKAIVTSDVNRYGAVLQKNGIHYIGINKTVNDDLYNSYLYEFGQFNQLQNKNFISEFLGEKIIDTGKFELYKISAKYYQDNFYFTNDGCSVLNSNATTESSFSLEIEYKQNESCSLIFKEPHHRLWLLKNGELNLHSTSSNEGQNSWEFTPTDNKIEITFEPNRLSKPLATISIATLGLSVVTYLLALYIEKRRDET